MDRILKRRPCSPKRRIETDMMKMLMSDYEVNLVNDNMQEFYVRFHGPAETPFSGGIWKVHVELPGSYSVPVPRRYPPDLDNTMPYRSIPVQESFYRFHESDLSSQH